MSLDLSYDIDFRQMRFVTIYNSLPFLDSRKRGIPSELPPLHSKT